MIEGRLRQNYLPKSSPSRPNPLTSRDPRRATRTDFRTWSFITAAVDLSGGVSGACHDCGPSHPNLLCVCRFERCVVVVAPRAAYGVVYALDAASGNLLWQYTTGNGVSSTFGVVNGMVYIGSWDNNAVL
jgi:outer membrane protein assembly factor BamB